MEPESFKYLSQNVSIGEHFHNCRKLKSRRDRKVATCQEEFHRSNDTVKGRRFFPTRWYNFGQQIPPLTLCTTLARPTFKQMYNFGQQNLH